MIGKGLFHTHLVVGDMDKSLRFYSGLFGMERIDFTDGTLVFFDDPWAQ
jgi:catechol 2,3-dioxygenase-like lactoylglutathione lyase family enzyme